MITQRELEGRLQADAQELDRDFPRADKLELRILARAAVTPREERRRALTLKQELALAGLFLVAAGLLAVGVGRLRSLTQPVPARPTPSVNPTPTVLGGGAPCYFAPRFGQTGVEPVKMLSPMVGWAAGGLRTTDGGAHWQDVAPSAMRQDAPAEFAKHAKDPPGYAEFYLDGNHAWEARSYGSAASCYGYITTFGTSDGGHSWYQSAPVGPAGSTPPQLFFSNPLQGWLLLFTGPTSFDGFPRGIEGARLYRTTDGGRHWRFVIDMLKAAPVGEAAIASGIPPANRCENWFGNLSFASPSTGWINVSCQTAPDMFVTHDGGATWSLLRLQSPADKWGCPCYTYAPIFFDQSRGIIQGCCDESGRTKLLATSDGGRSWQALPPPPGQYWSLIDFADANHFWALITPPGWNKSLPTPHDSLYRSSDGGRTWALVRTNLPIGVAYTLLFLDADHGIVDQPQNGTINGPQTVLLTTSDGGHTWKSVEPQGLPSPCC